MVCLTLGFVLNAFELKLFDSLSVAKKLHENVHLGSFTIAMLATNGAIFSCSILDPVMTTNQFWTTKQLPFSIAYEKEHIKYCGKSTSCFLDFKPVGVILTMNRLQCVTGP